MSRHLTVTVLLILASASPAFGAAATAPGACYDAVRSSTPSDYLPRDLGGYCFHLRDGLERYKNKNYWDALASFERAADAAARIVDVGKRGLAQDEARGARALVLEAMGDAMGAEKLLNQPSSSPVDPLVLLRAFFLVRQDLLKDAAAALDTAKATLPAEFWATAYERAAEKLRAGVAPGYDQGCGWDLSEGHFLPSYLTPAAVVGCPAKGTLIDLPHSRSFQVLFDLGKAAWKDTPANRDYLDRMVSAITGQNKKNGAANLTWVITGHTDQSCPRAHPDATGCAAYNRKLSLNRAKTIVEKLSAKSGVPGDRLKSDGMGMDRPLRDVGFGREETVNRRVELTVESASSAASTTECPWTVRVYDNALPSAGGSTAVPSVAVAGKASMAISANSPALNVSKDAVYEILFDGADGGGWKSISAMSELSDGSPDNLLNGPGGLRDPDHAPASLVSVGGRLPIDKSKYFKVNGTRTLQTIILSVSEDSIPIFDRLVQAPSSGASRTELASVPRTSVSKAMGAAKGATDRTGRSVTNPSFANDTTSSPRGATVSTESPPKASTQETRPSSEVLDVALTLSTVKSCFFTFGFR